MIVPLVPIFVVANEQRKKSLFDNIAPNDLVTQGWGKGDPPPVRVHEM